MTQKLFPLRSIVASLTLFAAIPASAEVRLLAEVGRPAVGFDPPFIYWDVDFPVIGRDGHIAFTGAADVSIGSTAQNTSAVWAGPPDSFDVILREDDPFTGLPANVLFDFLPVGSAGAGLVVSKSGRVAMNVRTKGAIGGTQPTFALVRHDSGTNTFVLGDNVQAPGFAAGVRIFPVPFQFAFSDAGMVIQGQTTSGQIALWYWDFASFTLIAASGTPVGPALPGCTTLTIGGAGGFSINDAGAIALKLGTFGAGCPTSAVMKWEAGTLSEIVRAGDAVPGMAGVTFNNFIIGSTRVNAEGDLSFGAGIRDDGTFVNATTLWNARAGGALELVAIQGESLPGLPGEFLSQNFAGQTNTADAASTAFLGFTTSFRDVILAGLPRAQPYSGVPVSGVSQLDLLAGLNDQPVGFGATWFYELLFAPSIGGAGYVTFGGVATDSLDPINSKTSTIWRGTSSADLERIAFQGQDIEVDGSTETITEVVPPNDIPDDNDAGESSQGGQPVLISDAGQVIFKGATSLSPFTDFPDAILLTDAAEATPVPVAGWAVTLCAAALCGLGASRRARLRARDV